MKKYKSKLKYVCIKAKFKKKIFNHILYFVYCCSVKVFAQSVCNLVVICYIFSIKSKINLRMDFVLFHMLLLLSFGGPQLLIQRLCHSPSNYINLQQTAALIDVRSNRWAIWTMLKNGSCKEWFLWNFLITFLTPFPSSF